MATDAAPGHHVDGSRGAWFSIDTAGQSGPGPSTKNGEWPHYTADMRGTEYSPLDQINAANFNKLEVAWRFKTDNLGPRPEFKLEGTPLMVKGVALHHRRHAPLGGRARRARPAS